jgi:hypothetical protein
MSTTREPQPLDRDPVYGYHPTHPTLPPVDWAANFKEFDKTNPEIYGLFRFFALELLAAGRTRYSARTIIERIRWHQATSSDDGEFKINNNYIAHYARKLAQEDSRFTEFFTWRKMLHEGGES